MSRIRVEQIVMFTHFVGRYYRLTTDDGTDCPTKPQYRQYYQETINRHVWFPTFKCLFTSVLVSHQNWDTNSNNTIQHIICGLR